MLRNRDPAVDGLIQLVDAIAIEIRHAATGGGSGGQRADGVAGRRIIGRRVLHQDRAVGRNVSAAAIAGVGAAGRDRAGLGADAADTDRVRRAVAGTEIAGVDRDIAVGIGAVAGAGGIDISTDRSGGLGIDGPGSEIVPGVDQHITAGIGAEIAHALRLRRDGADSEIAGRIQGDPRIGVGVARQMTRRHIAQSNAAAGATHIDAALGGKQVEVTEREAGSRIDEDAVGDEVDGLRGSQRQGAWGAQFKPLDLLALATTGKETQRDIAPAIDKDIAVARGERAGGKQPGRYGDARHRHRIDARAIQRGDGKIAERRDIANSQRPAVLRDRHAAVDGLIQLFDAVAIEVRHAAAGGGGGGQRADDVTRRRIVGGKVLNLDRPIGRNIGVAVVAGVGGASGDRIGLGADAADTDRVRGAVAGTEVAGVHPDVAVGIGAVAGAGGIDVAADRSRDLGADGPGAEVVPRVEQHIAARVGAEVTRALRLGGDAAHREIAGRIQRDPRIGTGIAGHMPR